MPALHPEDVFGNTGLNCDGEATHASGGAGEAGGCVDANLQEGCGHPLSDERGGGARIRVQSEYVVRSPLELWEQWGTDRAAGVRSAALDASNTRASASHVHEQSQLIHQVQGRVDRATKAHMMAFALLVLFANAAVERGTALEGDQTTMPVVVKPHVAGGLGGRLGGSLAANSVDDGDQLVAKRGQRGGVLTEETKHMLPCDGVLVGELRAQQAGDASGKTSVLHVAFKWRRKAALPVASDDRVDDGLNNGARAADHSELPHERLQRDPAHGKDAVKGVASGGPSHDSAPISPGLGAGGRCRSQGHDVRLKGGGHGLEGGPNLVCKTLEDRLPIAFGILQSGRS